MTTEPEDGQRQEKNIARCFLFKDGDGRNQCVLTTRNLKIIHRKKEYIFRIRAVNKIGIERKKILLPLLAAGIILPLVIVAFMEFSLGPLTTVLTILTGIFVFYIGWNGSEVLVIHANDLTHYFPFRQENENVRRFVTYAGMVVRGLTGWELCYFIPVKKPGENGDGLEFIVKNHDHLKVFDYNAFLNYLKPGSFTEEDIVYIFDPVNSSIRIQYFEEDLVKEIKAFFPENLTADDFRLITTISDFSVNYLKRKRITEEL
jgi:hypothetical protein